MSPLVDVLRRISMDPEGLLEIHVVATDFNDWNRLLNGLDRSRYPMSLCHVDSDVPVHIEQGMFCEGDPADYTLRIGVGRQEWTSGLYSTLNIDLQGDAKDITEIRDLEDVVTFMKDVHRLLDKQVSLLPETPDPIGASAYLRIP